MKNNISPRRFLAALGWTVTAIIFLSAQMASAAELLSDDFTGTTIDTSKWTEADAGGLGGTVGNIQQNGSLTTTGSATWGLNYLYTDSTYDRSSGGLEMEADVTCASGSSVMGIGYGDPGVLTGGGQSYTMYVVSNVIYFSRQQANGNAENFPTGVNCTNGVPFHIRITVGTTTGAALYINGSGTAAATAVGGTFNNKGFFLSGHSGTATVIDNFVINGLGAAVEPDAPTDLDLTPSAGQILVDWTAPGSNGGASITDYLVEYKLTSTSTWATFADGTSASTEATVTGLTNGLAYNFRVSATNSVGTGIPSDVATGTPALSVPSAPLSLSASSDDNGQSELTWSEPLTDGGASITDYLVEYKQSSTSTWATFADGTSASTGATVTGLTNGVAYNFRVSATNSVGTGIVSSSATGTPNTYTLSDSFTGTTIDTSKWTETDASGLGGTTGGVQQNGSLTIVPAGAWATQNGVSTVNTYDRTDGDVSMEFSVTRSACGSGVGPVAAGYGDFNFTIGGSSSYILLSNAGNWELYYWEGGSNQSGSPDLLTGITSCTNGVPTTFELVAHQGGGASVFVNGSSTASANIAGGTFTDKGFWFGGLNSSGTVAYDDVAIIEPNVGPLSPTGLTPTAGSGEVALSWTSGGDNGSAITDYLVEYKLTSTSTWATFADGTSASTGATVTGLTNGLSYKFRVSAINGNGSSNPSSEATATPVSGTASAPTAIDVTITGTASLGEVLSGSYTFADANGNSEATSLYRWLRSDSAGGTYTAISGATSEDYTVTSDDLNMYLKFEVTPVSNTAPTTGSAALSAATDQVADVDYLYHILSTGQSLSVGVAASPALSTTQPYSNVMLTGGAGGLGSGTSFTSLIESSVETMSSAMANTITANSEGEDLPVAVGLHGVSGYTYSQLKKGTGPYSTGMTQVTNTKNAAAALGMTSRVIGVTTIHGETDNFNNVSGATYQGYLEEWQSDYETDVKAITGQSGTIPLFLDQMSSYMSSYANDATSEIPIYQLKAAEDNPDKIYVVGPKYYYSYSDRHHLTAASSRWDGEYYGKVIKKVSIDHEDWRPLSPDSAVRSGNVIYADFHVPAGELEFDTTLVSERDNYGFEYYDTTSSATISSVEIFDEDTVKVTLSGVPTGSNQRLRYAYTGVPGTNTGAQNDGSAAGNLRDTDPYPSLYGNTLYNWAVHFDEPITVDSSAPAPASVAATVDGESDVTIAWTTDESSTSQVEYGLSSTYTASTTESVSRNTSHSVTLSGLASCTTYHYRVRTEDLGNNSTYSSDASFTTECTGGATVVDETSESVDVVAGGAITHGAVSVTVPVGFTDQTTTVMFQAKELDTTTFFAAAGYPDGKSGIGNLVINLTALANATQTISSFDEPITVTFSYDDGDVAGIDESTLVIYRHDGSSWHALTGCVVDTDANTVTCETSNFSDFGLFGDEIVSAEVSTDSGRRGTSGSRRRVFATKPAASAAPDKAVTQAPQTPFTRNLDVGTTGEDVKALQAFLNANGYAVASSGPGSPGSETTMFGYATRAALARYQAANGIVPAIGYFGPLTRATVSGSATVIVPSTFSAPQTATGSSDNSASARDLDIGMSGEDVKVLQASLIKLGYSIPAGVTGYFGAQTKAALAQYQIDNGIVPSQGVFDEQTRTRME